MIGSAINFANNCKESSQLARIVAVYGFYPTLFSDIAY
jgi:hypothetical protein